MRGVVFVFFLAALLALVKCNEPPAPVAAKQEKVVRGQASAFKYPQENAVKQITKAEREAIIAKATKGLVLNFDKIERVSFYSTAKIPGEKEQIFVYIAVPDGMAPTVRIFVSYNGNSWLFFNKLKIVSDGVTSIDKTFYGKSDNVTKNLIGTKVFESVDFYADYFDIGGLRQIANSKSATMRLYGPNRVEDHDVTFEEIKRIAVVLYAFDQMKAIH